MIDHEPAQEGTCPRADTVGHEHEQPLCARPDLDIRLALDKKRARNIEKVECHTIYDHRQHKKRQTASGISDPKQSKPKDPGKYAHQDHRFDPEPPEEKRDGENEQGFGNLRYADQHHAMTHRKSAGILRDFCEISDKAIGKRIADLQRESEKHGEDKEDQHFFLPEKDKGVQAQRGIEAASGSRSDGNATRQGEGIHAEYNARRGTYPELVMALLPTANIDYPHRTDEPHSAPDTDRRKIPDDIEPPLLEDDIGDGVVQGYRRHKEAAIQQHREVEPSKTGQSGSPDHDAGAKQVGYTQHALGVDPTVSHDPE